MKIFLTVFCAASLTAQEPLTERERMLLDRIENLERRLAVLEARPVRLPPAPAPPVASPSAAINPKRVPPAILPEGATINVNVDGYYGYNFHHPAGGANTLRAYDVSANNLSLNQAGIILERPADLSVNRRFGARLDLMFGQATETLQGSPANELRPGVYRHVFQAYGTWVAPVGKGLAVDFGKFASSFGIEGNYSKDQINYTRSYWFNFLPFYHMGFRASYPLTAAVSINYWLTNGTNQTEDFNGFRSHAVLLNFRPSPLLSASLNYFNGQEQRQAEGRTPRGRSHILNSYMTWQASGNLTMAAEASWVISRVEPSSSPQRVTGGAAYARLRFHPQFSLAGRFAYLNDSGGLFSGVNQSLKDVTLTAAFDVAAGFQMRGEYRRDWSNVPYFPALDPNQPSPRQNTVLLGLIWWFGGKQGVW